VWPAHHNGSEDVSDARVRHPDSQRLQVISLHFDLSTGHGCRGLNPIQLRCVFRGGVKEAHRPLRVERGEIQYKEAACGLK
jgi:hypothetical protein